jgi:MtN3 and saliva related transmembrane protein
MSDSIECLGYVAALLTTYAFVPQAMKVWREDDTRAISLGMYCLFLMGVSLWMVYGIAIGSYPMILANGITFLLAASILFKKLAHLRRGEQ